MIGSLVPRCMSIRTLTILGSTGSIGTNTLDVVRQNPDRFRVFALAAGRNIELLAQQIQEFSPQVVVLQDAGGRGSSARAASIRNSALHARAVERARGAGTDRRAPEVDTVMSSIVGVAGLEATYEAVCRGKRVGLANKEVLVSGGQLVMEAVAAARRRTDPGGFRTQRRAPVSARGPAHRKPRS